ncbi:RrF2 family transcriptional regulator [Portibacter lacus]|uniref:Transcriptional regulator n=1 Tax=Portibacter lacus TaxID=1099794 RepID=A0AA37SQ18_9BACT|nr:Rrf2 family transcriptional regulator [Portibacter lacus]GLR17467.1 hypothetical protein GCM10007940_20820 [Portibacter lacus]
MFSKACEYGIKATVHICIRSQQHERVSLKNIAEKIDSPIAFTAKILQSLAKNDIINSSKGAKGGYEMSEDNFNKITLLDIVKAIDGDNIYNGCGLGYKNCNAKKPCPMHFQFKSIRDDLKKMLETTTLQELADDINEGTSFLVR